MMSPERFQELLDIYGASEERWPEDQRVNMRAALDAYPQLRQHLFAARELDLMLDRYSPEPVDLQQRILDAVPASALERLLTWLLPDVPQLWWRPAMAAALPLLLGLAMGIQSPGLLSVSATTDWEAQERSLLIPVTGVEWYE